MQFFSDTHIDFIGKRRAFYVVSAIVILAGLVLATIRGVPLGIDFEGGTEVAFKFSETVAIEEIRGLVNDAGFEGAEIKNYGGEDEVLIRVKTPEDPGVRKVTSSEVSQQLSDALTQKYGEGALTLLKAENIEPKIGEELRLDALLAVILSVVAILIYIAFRFELIYGFGAVVALIHDVLVTFAFVQMFHGLFGLNLEMNQGMLAAFLTVVGFSINDTVIIFDRIRENKTVHRGENMMMLMNRSINEVLPRTVNTSLTVILVLAVLLFLSGEVLAGFAFAMLIGIITGTYSSIYIASALVVDVLIRQKKLDPEAQRDFTEQTTQLRSQRRGAVSAKA